MLENSVKQNLNIEFSNSIIKDRIQILINTPNKLVFRTFLEPNGGQNELHYHSNLIESFKIVKGELNVLINKNEYLLKAGDRKVISPTTNHMFYNKSKKEVVFDVEVINPKEMMIALQIMYGLVNDGKTNSKGLPHNILYTAITLNKMDAYTPTIPYIIQKAGICILAALGKVFGLEKKLIKKYCV